jgi:hypothetical protein
MKDKDGRTILAVAEDAGEEGLDTQTVIVAEYPFVERDVSRLTRFIREIPYCSCNGFSIPSFSLLMEGLSF